MKVRPTRWLKELGLATLVRINRGSLPDFIVVGAQKAGSSSLFAALTSHPKIGSSLRKEVHYFDLRRHSHPLSWYCGHFTPQAKRRIGSITGEASPSYMFFPDCADAIAATCPRARILIVLREPAARALSHYRHNRRTVPHLETETNAAKALFAEQKRVGSILADLANASPQDRALAARFAYLSRGHYADQITRFYSAFGKQQVMVLESEDLSGAPDNGIGDRLCEFLGVPRHTLTFERRNADQSERPVDPDLQCQLETYFAPHDAQLADLLGRRLSWQAEVQS